MSQVSFPDGLTNRDCEKQVSDRPPLPFVPLATSTGEDSVFKGTGEPRQLEIKLSEDLKMPKNIFDGGTPEQFLYHIQQTLDILRKKLLIRWDSCETTRKEKYALWKSTRQEWRALKLSLASATTDADDRNSASHDSGHRDSRARRSEHTDTDETGMDSHDRGIHRGADARRLEELRVQKFSFRKNYKEAIAQQQDVMVEVFNTYDSLLSEAQRGEWTKIVKDLCHSDTYVTRRNKPREGPRGLTREAFYDCIHAHLLTVFAHDAAEQERHYLQCCVKKSLKISIRQFISRMSQLNGYLSMLPCLYDSEYAINTTCRMDKPFSESELAQIVLDAVPAIWRSQYNINHKTVPTDLHSLLTDLEKVERYVEATRAQEQRSQKKNEKGKSGTPTNNKPRNAGIKRNASSESSIPRKKAKSTKMCQLCQKYGGASTTHNTNKVIILL